MSKLFRSICLTICVILFGIGSLLLNWIIFPLITLFCQDERGKLKLSSFLVQNSWKFLIRLMILFNIFDLKISDIDKLTNIKNAIVVSSHPSYIDVLILIAFIPKMTCFSAERFTSNFFMNNIVKTLFITRGNSLEQMVANAQKMLDFGFNVLIFPSGIRHKVNKYPKIRKGASLIALNSRKNIIPIKMTSDVEFLQINNSICDAGSKKPHFNIIVKDEIITNEYIEAYPDEVDCKKELTSRISNELYL